MFLFSSENTSPTPFFRNKTILWYALSLSGVFVVLRFLDTGLISSLIDTFFSLFPFILVIFVAFLSYFKYAAYRKAAMNLPHIEGIREKMRIQTLQTIAALLGITFFFYLLVSPESFFAPASALSSFLSLFISLTNLFLIITFAVILLLAGGFIFLFIRFFKTRHTDAYPSFEAFRTKFLQASFAAVFSLLIFSFVAFADSYHPITDYTASALASLMGGNRQSDLSLTNALAQTVSSLRRDVSQSSANLSSDIVASKEDLDKTIARASVNVTGKLTEDLKQKLANDGGVLSGNLIVKGTLDVLNETTLRDILPEKDNVYNLGKSSKGWSDLFVHQINGIGGALRIGSVSSSHSLDNSNALIVGGDTEVNGTLYADGTLLLSKNPTQNMEASTKEYVDNQIGSSTFLNRTGTTISPENSGDTWDFEGGSLTNISNLTLSGNLSLGTTTAGLWHGTAIGVGYGGTGLAATPTNGQFPIGNGTGYTLATLTGTSNQITVTNGAGSITLSLPQNIATTSSPTFAGLTLTSALSVANGGTGVTSFGGTNRLLYTTSTDTIS
ncbi:MAG: hypothetical protein WAU31_00995, partial [Candidatus Moraniibacteriota bacterium]